MIDKPEYESEGIKYIIQHLRCVLNRAVSYTPRRPHAPLAQQQRRYNAAPRHSCAAPTPSPSRLKNLNAAQRRPHADATFMPT